MSTGQIDVTQAMGKLFLQQEIVANLTPADEDSALCAPGQTCIGLTCFPARSIATCSSF